MNSVLVLEPAGPNTGSSVSHSTKSSESLDPDSATDYFPESEHLVLEKVLSAANLVPTETETLTGAYIEQEASVHSRPPVESTQPPASAGSSAEPAQLLADSTPPTADSTPQLSASGTKAIDWVSG